MSDRETFGVEPPLSAIRNFILAVGVLAIATWAGCSSITRVDAGHVGVKVHLAGDARGVQSSPTVQGWVFYNPLTEQVIQFPTSVQNVVWSASLTEGRRTDESITFSSKEGASINADIGVAFHIAPETAPKLYARFRQTDMGVLADTFIRNNVRESFNEMSSTMPVQDIYGSGKNKLVLDVTKRVRDALSPEGIVLDQLTINGALRLPPNVVESINRALEATQNAIQAENRVRQIKAEAEQAITQAQGGAEAARQKAQGDGDAALIRARAEAKANEIIRLSTTPAVLAYRQIDRWDGRLPMYSGGPLPMMTIDAGKMGELSEAERRKLLDAELAPPVGTTAPATIPAPATSASTGTDPLGPRH